MSSQLKQVIQEAKQKYLNFSLIFMKTAPQKFWNYISPKRSQRSPLTPAECCAHAILLNNYFKSVFTGDDNCDPPFDYVGSCADGNGQLIITEAGVFC